MTSDQSHNASAIAGRVKLNGIDRLRGQMSCDVLLSNLDVAEANNWGLAERFGITMDDLPIIKLFVGGEEKATFTDTTTCDNLRRFVTDNTGRFLLSIRL